LTRVVAKDIVKRFGKNTVLNKINLTIESGEFFAIVGPSGSGKTTLLRVLAGFEYPDSGRLFFDETDVTFKRPDERGAAMVFQNWALWPHMTVFDNIAYGLKIKGLSKDEIRKKVKWALELLGLEGLEKRYPHQLSGGQQQRVALARALVVEPKVILMDEPLSNLDARLRLKLRGEIKKIQRELGITAIYVTHDQEEALAMADRLALLNRGEVVEVGTPEEIYRHPKRAFTAIFIGKTSTGFAEILGKENEEIVRAKLGELEVKAVNHGVKEGEKALLVFKSDLAKARPREGYISIVGKVTVSMYMGSYVEVRMVPRGYDRELIFYPSEPEPPKLGTEHTVFMPINGIHAYPITDEVKSLIKED